MKSTGLVLLMLAFFHPGNSQPNRSYGEFAIKPNGLIYADSTMLQLKNIVDSLNLRFRTCDNNAQYYSCPQGKIFEVSFASAMNTMADLRKDLDANMEFNTLIKKHDKLISKLNTTQFVVRIDREEDKPYFLIGDASVGFEYAHLLTAKPLTGSNSWVFDYSAKGQFRKENEVKAYFIPEGLAQRPLSKNYGKYIQYVDCMVDTGSVILRAPSKTRPDERYLRLTYEELNNYLNQKMNLKARKIKDSLYLDYEVHELTEKKLDYAQANLTHDKVFIKLVSAATNACILYGGGSFILDEMAAKFISPHKALEMMRNRKVVGSCSQDESPRIHARNIAITAASSKSWDIFLRAHLDILNDRFDRMSDGSYAYGNRKTYLKELELLNLDIVGLMLGLSLRAANTSSNHYNGTVWRLGWALTESKDSTLFENKVKEILGDAELDQFNRGLIFFLYRSYLYALPNLENANTKIRVLKNEATQYPADIQAAIKDLTPRSAQKGNDM